MGNLEKGTKNRVESIKTTLFEVKIEIKTPNESKYRKYKLV